MKMPGFFTVTRSIHSTDRVIHVQIKRQLHIPSDKALIAGSMSTESAIDKLIFPEYDLPLAREAPHFSLRKMQTNTIDEAIAPPECFC